MSSDPSGSIVRKAFLIEAFLNLLSFPLITNTKTTLYYLLLNSKDINESTILFTRLFGGIIIGGLTTSLIYGSKYINSRRNTYYTLGFGEILLIPILSLELFKSLEEKNQSALSFKTSLISICLLLPPLIWRIYILFIRPDLIGNEKELKKLERQPLLRDDQH
ncbi:uncharacterized protein I206_106944 [Kwoniella pini CBS 10737]|uniref:Uncharacterized protein n=1 Tax=Kwoniella pini CBS 10737 TaxID=1296096 RepID=A0A1B9HZN6_9TREE|nr:uncharacterized protein I206_05513 [Kwoniella pini CBS 10737]OCF48732.1 hypothetical protein I206_05513 [Kwoniella pini CBS 10737]